MIEDVLYDNQIDQFREMLDEHKDISLAIDFTYIPHIITKYWRDFAHRFDDDLVPQNMLWIIRKGRNKCEHKGSDLDIDFVQTHLFLISDILRIINRTDKQDEVVNIRNELLSSDIKKKLTEQSDHIEKVEDEKKEYKKQYLETNRQLETVKKEQSKDKERINELLHIKEEKEKIEKENIKLSKELKETEEAWNSTEMSLKSKEKQLTDEINAHDSLKARVTSLNEQIEATEKENNRYKTRLDDEKQSTKKQLESMRNECEMLEKESQENKARLNAIEKQLYTSSLLTFPSNETDSSVRILDRRNTDKGSYLTKLLALNQPTIIYVDCEKRIDKFFKDIVGEKADCIGRYNGYSSESDEIALLEQVANEELIAIVSNGSLPKTSDDHGIEHFVFCHPILDLDEFCNQCQPAFMSRQSAYLHLIYDTKREFDSYTQVLNDLYPSRSTLEKIYKYVKEHEKTNGKSVTLEHLCQELDIKRTRIETGFDIFNELHLIERIDQDITLLKPSEHKQLEDSKIYTEGEKLREKADQDAYQLGMDSIENLWDKILDTLDIEKKHIIQEQPENTYQTNNGSQHETEIDEIDSAETEQVDTPKHSRAKVNAEQVKDIRERAADGETLSNLSKEYGMSSTGIWNLVNRNTWKEVE